MRTHESTKRRYRARAAACLSLLLLTSCELICLELGFPAEVCDAFAPADQTPLGDLQVSIEVRFIGVSDEFFERIGVDFDFNIDQDAAFENSNTGFNASTTDLGNASIASPTDVGGPDNTPTFVPRFIGGTSSLLPTLPTNMSVPQINFFPSPFGNANINLTNGMAIPDFNDIPGGSLGFDMQTADVASFGFAILSDIEASFFLQAAQADSNNGVLSAPKVTLFNGQAATVISKNEDTTINDVEPEFANAAISQVPNIQFVHSGPSLRVVPVVSADRRFVRLQLVPVRAIQFPLDDEDLEVDDTPRQILFPVVRIAMVQTTVSVPDGGTILLGGMKRMSDGVNVRGVPILNKLPYINRLFKNVGVLRDSQNLMLMVTPRIIIQEEQEE